MSKVDDVLLGWSNHGGSNHITRKRSKSLETSRANEHAVAKENAPISGRKRSKSIESSRANDWAKQRSSMRSTTSQNSKRGSGGFSSSRSVGRDASKSNQYATQIETEARNSFRKDRSGRDAFAARAARRSRSRGRSSADVLASEKDSKRSRSKERSGADVHAGRSRSKERSGADAYAKKDNRKSGRSLSIERSRANGYSQKEAGRRSRSVERSAANDFAKKDTQSSARRSHSQSKGVSGGRGPASERRRSRSRSVERSKANDYVKSSYRKPESDRRKAKAPSSEGLIDVQKKTDGTVIVARRRKRDDGAVVMTKTKYANIALARKHGIDV